MMSPVDKVAVLVCHPTKKVNKAEEPTSLSTNIVLAKDKHSTIFPEVQQGRKRVL